MTEASDMLGMLYQNLIDAGCNQDMSQQCIVLIKENKTTDLMRLLSCHRAALLDTVHENQKKIDCLDFLLFQINKGKKQRTK